MRLKLIAFSASLAKEIYAGATKLGGNAVWFETKEEFLEKKDEIIAQGDTILVKASHFMNFTKIVEALK